jgi:hypothetical protein
VPAQGLGGDGAAGALPRRRPWLPAFTARSVGCPHIHKRQMGLRPAHGAGNERSKALTADHGHSLGVGSLSAPVACSTSSLILAQPTTELSIAAGPSACSAPAVSAAQLPLDLATYTSGIQCNKERHDCLKKYAQERLGASGFVLMSPKAPWAV